MLYSSKSRIGASLRKKTSSNRDPKTAMQINRVLRDTHCWIKGFPSETEEEKDRESEREILEKHARFIDQLEDLFSPRRTSEQKLTTEDHNTCTAALVVQKQTNTFNPTTSPWTPPPGSRKNEFNEMKNTTNTKTTKTNPKST